MTDFHDNSAVLADELIGWFLRQLPYTGWLLEQYVKWDENNISATLEADFDALYRETFNSAYTQVLTKEPESFYETGLLILLAWQKMLKTEFRNTFVNEINRRLILFHAPIRLTPKGLFHEIDPETVDYEDATPYQPARYEALNVILVVVLVLLILCLFFGLSMQVTNSFIPPELL